jgi:hypothetical protein
MTRRATNRDRILMRPRPDGPLYEARLKRDGTGWVMVPYFAEPDAARDLTCSEVEDFKMATSRAGGTVVWL